MGVGYLTGRSNPVFTQLNAHLTSTQPTERRQRLTKPAPPPPQMQRRWRVDGDAEGMEVKRRWRVDGDGE